MADRRSLEGLLKSKLQVDGRLKASQYVEMPDVLLPEEERESGETRAKIQERMRKISSMGAVGMGTSTSGAGVRDLGKAMSVAQNDAPGSKLNVKEIAKKADMKLPRETAQCLRAGSSMDSSESCGVRAGSKSGPIKFGDRISSQKLPGSTSPVARKQSDASRSPAVARLASGKFSHSPLVIKSPSFEANRDSVLIRSPIKKSAPASRGLIAKSLGSSEFNLLDEDDSDLRRRYTLKELQMPGVCPDGVNAARKEDSMRLSDFQDAFGVTPEEFAKYPEWKKIELRKLKRIF